MGQNENKSNEKDKENEKLKIDFSKIDTSISNNPFANLDNLMKKDYNPFDNNKNELNNNEKDKENEKLKIDFSKIDTSIPSNPFAKNLKKINNLSIDNKKINIFNLNDTILSFNNCEEAFKSKINNKSMIEGQKVIFEKENKELEITNTNNQLEKEKGNLFNDKPLNVIDNISNEDNKVINIPIFDNKKINIKDEIIKNNDVQKMNEEINDNKKESKSDIFIKKEIIINKEIKEIKEETEKRDINDNRRF